MMRLWRRLRNSLKRSRPGRFHGLVYMSFLPSSPTRVFILRPPRFSPLSVKSKPGLSRRVWFSWQRPKATGRSFAPRLGKVASVVLKSMMPASPRSAAIMAFASYGLPIETSPDSRHSPSSTRWYGKANGTAPLKGLRYFSCFRNCERRTAARVTFSCSRTTISTCSRQHCARYDRCRRG